MGGRSRTAGTASALIGALLIALGCILIGQLPAPEASGQDVYARFLDDQDSLRVGATMLVIGLTLLLVFLTVLRGALDPERRMAASAIVLSAGVLAVGAAVFSAAAIGALAVGAEDAAPDSSRAVLDLSQAAAAVAGPLAAAALLASAAAMRETGAAPRRLHRLAALAALGCLLWIAPLITDAAALAPGSKLGFVLGLVLLLAWVVATALRLRRIRPAQ